MSRVVRKFRTPAAMARFAAGLFARALRGRKDGPLLAALSGGKTPAALFGVLAGLKADWGRVHFFMADERLVPPVSPASNFGQARRLLFSKIKVPPGNLHPVKVGLRGRAAAAYAGELAGLAGPSGALDVVFLGLGGDGHTASLFPGSPALRERKALAAASSAPPGVKPRPRVTLTFKALNAARTVVLLASGPEKRAVFEKAAAGDRSIPAGRLRPRGKFYLLYSEK